MALKVQASFAAGELDPALHERTTLQKYSSGLATARNVIIGKTGRVVSRPGRKFFKAARVAGKKIVVYSPPASNILFEVGHLKMRVHHLEGAWAPQDFDHDFTEGDLENIHFENSLEVLYMFCEGKTTRVFYFGSLSFMFYTLSAFFGTSVTLPNLPVVTASGTPPTGYDVDYAVTMVVLGVESLYRVVGSGKLPIAAGTSNSITCLANLATPTEMRVYRRPRNGGAYGYIGSSSSFSGLTGTFTDIGQEADYTHQPPSLNTNFIQTSTSDMICSTGSLYQQRLCLVNPLNKEVLETSRPGYAMNFYRDYPLSSDSALTFKSGSAGGAKILRTVDNDGLVAFTTTGVFLHTGALSPTNLSFEKKGGWVIDPKIPPIAIPGGVLFVDAATNTVRCLAWSTEAAAYSGEELSVFSDHLFQGKKIKSWAFHQGETPLLWVVYSDGTFSSFTYERDHEMRAWTRHDVVSTINVEAVCSTGIPEKTIFVVEKDGERYIEVTNARYATADTLSTNTEAELGVEIAYMDSIVTYDGKLNGSLGSNHFTFTALTTKVVLFEGVPFTVPDYEGPLTLTCGTAGIFTSPGPGAVGEVLRVFDEDGAATDLTVTARASNNSITVQPSNEFPVSLVLSANVYRTTTTVTGLSHLDGEQVAIVMDGYVVASPNNDIEDYPTVTVASGSITLPSSLRGAIIHVGRPIVGDTETLDIDTVEQRPVLIESKTVNKLYVKIHRTRGLYCGASFPANDKVDGMEDMDLIEVDYEEGESIVGNKYTAPMTKRLEVTIPGDWDSNGRICLRQVDPLHFEILSILPDLEDMRR